MFKKVNARERIVGWYHTGPRLKANDMAIHELIQKSMPAGHDATLGKLFNTTIYSSLKKKSIFANQIFISSIILDLYSMFLHNKAFLELHECAAYPDGLSNSDD